MLHLPTDKPRICTIESEYGFFPQPSVFVMRDVADAMPELHMMVSDTPSRGLASNGARIYPDQIKNLEHAAAEQYTKRGMLSNHFSGEVIIERITPKIFGKETAPYKRTCDSTGKTRGDHENYLTGKEEVPSKIAPMLLPHLISRVVFTGSGMVLQNPGGQSWSYILSQRAHDLGGKVCNASATTDRSKPFIIDRDDHFDSKKSTRRLQLGCGEANMFAFPVAFRLLSTSLVLRLIERGEYPEGLQLHDDQNPFQAIDLLSRDPDMQAKVHLANDSYYTGPELSAEINSAVMKLAEEGELPPDEQTMAETWRQMSSDVMEGDIDKWDRHIEHYAKLKWLHKKDANEEGDHRASRAAERDIKWHRVGRNSISHQLRERGAVADMPTQEDINTSIEEPIDITRATRRGAALKKHKQLTTSINYNRWYENGKLLTVNNAYQS